MKLTQPIERLKSTLMDLNPNLVAFAAWASFMGLVVRYGVS